MKPFTNVTGKIVALPEKDIDTDLIIPAQFLTSVSSEGYGVHLFSRLREQDPSFPLNNPAVRNAPILLSGENFGCGSSREHAVWALKEWGIQVIIAESFADIFTNNSAKNGLLLVCLPQDAINTLLSLSKESDLIITVDLEKMIVTTNKAFSFPFEYDSFRRHCLLNGLDDLEYVLSYRDVATAFFESRKTKRFFTSPSSLLGAKATVTIP